MSLVDHIKSQFREGSWSFILGLASMSYLLCIQANIAGASVETLRVYTFLSYITLIPMLVSARTLGQVYLISCAKQIRSDHKNRWCAIALLTVACLAILLCALFMLPSYFELTNITNNPTNRALFLLQLFFGFCFALNLFAKNIAIANDIYKRACSVDLIIAVTNFGLQMMLLNANIGKDSLVASLLISSTIIGFSTLYFLEHGGFKFRLSANDVMTFIRENDDLLNSEFILQLTFASAPFFLSLALQRTIGGQAVALVGVCTTVFCIWDRFFAAQAVVATVYLVRHFRNRTRVAMRIQALRIMFAIGLLSLLVLSFAIRSMWLSAATFQTMPFHGVLYWFVMGAFVLESIGCSYIPLFRAQHRNYVIAFGELLFGPHITASLLWLCHQSIGLDAVTLGMCLMGPNFAQGCVF